MMQERNRYMSCSTQESPKYMCQFRSLGTYIFRRHDRFVACQMFIYIYIDIDICCQSVVGIVVFVKRTTIFVRDAESTYQSTLYFVPLGKSAWILLFAHVVAPRGSISYEFVSNFVYVKFALTVRSDAIFEWPRVRLTSGAECQALGCVSS